MRWAIIGTGTISHQFASDAGEADSVEVVAVCSRNKENGEAFAKEFSIENVYTDYSYMLEREDIDNIYVGTPHTTHKEVTEYFLERGKNVLCEKPLGVNKKEVLSMIKTAKDNDCLLMEAMWTVFFPAVIKVKKLLDNKYFGKINDITGTMGIRAGDTHDKWRYHNRMAGGALLDIGIYPIHFYLYMFGVPPTKCIGLADIDNGIDRTDKVIMDFEGTLASFHTSIVTALQSGYDIYCENGSMHLSNAFSPSILTLRPLEGKETTIDYRYEKGGMQYEIQAFEDAAKLGKKEMTSVTYDKMIEAVEIMDSLRKSWGLVYPSDD